MPPAESNDRPLALIETDAFCEGCGFNLRSQPIWRDERLGLLVCRCPECGAHQSAAGRTSAATPWLHRLALLAATIWVGVALAYTAGLFGSMFTMQVIAGETLTTHGMRTDDGVPVTYSWNNGKQSIVRTDGDPRPLTATRVIVGRALLPFLGGPESPNDFYRTTDSAMMWLVIGTAFFAACLYGATAVVAAATWFWRPRWRWLWLAMPPLVAVGVAMLLIGENRVNFALVNALDQPIVITRDHRTELGIAAVVGVAQTLIVALGLLTGRKFVRGLLLIFAPPGVRQLFAFLWHCDGKTMPPARAAVAAP